MSVSQASHSLPGEEMDSPGKAHLPKRGDGHTTHALCPWPEAEHDGYTA